MTAESVSVLIPHYGDAAGTMPLIQQLQSQVGVFPDQLIVVDDASPETFPDVAGVDVIRRPRNGGFAAAVNSGLEAVRSDRVLVLNSDVSVPEDFLGTLLAGAAPLWPAVVTTRVKESYGERCMGHLWPTPSAVVVEHLVPFARFQGERWFEHRTSNLIESVAVTEPMLVDWVTGICMLMPTDDVRAVGGLDERYFMNCEEVDLQKRLWEERGLPAYVLPAPVISHIGGGSSPSERRGGWLLDARVRYFEKWGGAAPLAGALVVTAGINLIWNSARRVMGRDVDALSSFRAEMQRTKHAWRTRR